MCGRYCACTLEELQKRFALKKIVENSPVLFPNYNVAPGTDVPVVLNTAPDELQFVRWGLIPSWAKSEKESFKPINARAESLTEKPMFKNLVRTKRCMVLADSFYEWKKVDGKKIPYRILLKDETPFAFAGLWDSWVHDGQELKTCLIVTTEPNEVVAPIHERMPVILKPDIERAWLSDIPLDETWMFLKPYDAALMKAYEVSPAINSVSNNSPSVIEPIVKLI